MSSARVPICAGAVATRAFAKDASVPKRKHAVNVLGRQHPMEDVHQQQHLGYAAA